MEFKKSDSIYEQIAFSIQENILNEEWQPGDRIPSVRETAGTIQVNPNTIMRTYSLLQDQGIIFNKRGIGYFVSDEARKIIVKMKKQVFTTEFLPEFFSYMDQLEIDWSELQVEFDNWKKINNENNN